MQSTQLRKKFLRFFEEKGHKEMPASSLIPENDPSVLFTTAGMQQFKRYYTHPGEALAKNVVTIQPCFRTSDIDIVGDESHLTFFEMLGNFSFGGYFKNEAIGWAYEFLTKELDIDPKKIHCSIFKGDKENPKDGESANILKEMDLKFKEFGREDNFWGPTGDEGPCGPTVEFYVDDVEVWNLVFNEYYKNKDGSFALLQQKGVDTGLGLERMLVVLNGLQDVYQTDVLLPIIQNIEEISGKKYTNFLKEFRIISDHIKAATFIISEGVRPSNLDRGYILRRLIRRAVRKEKLLGIAKPLISLVAQAVIISFSKDYPNIEKYKDFIKKILSEEEEKFQKPLNWVLQYKTDLEAAINRNITKKIKDVPILSDKNTASGAYIHENYQTYGVPPDLSQEVVKELGLKVDLRGFEEALKKHQELSRTASVGKFKGGLQGESEKTIKLHTATHLLLKALQEVLGPNVHQRGSNITEERLRFDFSHPDKLTEEQIQKVEDIVNHKIRENLPVTMEEMTVEQAKQKGAEAQFISKYGDKVRVYSIGDYSVEICGGPHAKSTGEIGHFKIIKEESSSSGIRRIKAGV